MRLILHNSTGPLTKEQKEFASRHPRPIDAENSQQHKSLPKAYLNDTFKVSKPLATHSRALHMWSGFDWKALTLVLHPALCQGANDDWHSNLLKGPAPNYLSGVVVS